ncbi:hypothetical protein ASE37_01575 [Rhizobium sp. Root268]|nr:hypothetical protein ASC86_01575 [Rhizobium sp. Root1212]KRD38711.1 hypothetical protein ASE37_01575 [Rhizobium sp. Root268]
MEKGADDPVKGSCAGPWNGQGEICTVVHPSQFPMEMRMADIIRIEERVSRPDRKMAMDATAGHEAVILLFTGIRYERLDKGDSIAPAPVKSGKKH